MLVHAGSCCTELLDAEATLEVDALNWNPPTLTLEGFLVADTKELEVIVEGFRTGLDSVTILLDAAADATRELEVEETDEVGLEEVLACIILLGFFNTGDVSIIFDFLF